MISYNKFKAYSTLETNYSELTPYCSCWYILSCSFDLIDPSLSGSNTTRVISGSSPTRLVSGISSVQRKGSHRRLTVTSNSSNRDTHFLPPINTTKSNGQCNILRIGKY